MFIVICGSFSYAPTNLDRCVGVAYPHTADRRLPFLRRRSIHAAMELDLVGELREQIAAGRVTCIVGAGVSIAATLDPARKPNFASWLGLLEHGIARCITVVPNLPKSWPGAMQTLIDLGKDGDTDALLNLADQITRKLGEPGAGEFRKWLRETIGSLRLVRADVPAALGALGVPLFTTNYDDTLELATNLPTVTWQDTAEVERVLRGEERAIVHLHGHWKRSETLVFGSSSYKDVVNSKHAQAVLRALRMTRTLLFVGFGAGLDDPNFGPLLDWTREVFKDSEIRHFQLARASEVAGIRDKRRPEERIFVLSYGEKHDELAPFLEGLVPRKTAMSAPVPVVLPSAPPRSRILVAGPFFGVPTEMRAEVTRIWINESYDNALSIIQAKLRRSEIRHAQIAAIARHDVIIDMSPWRAFSTRWSLGLRDIEVERDSGSDASSTPLVFFAFPKGEKSSFDAAAPAVVEARLRALRTNNPILTDRLDPLAWAGFSLSGFDATTAQWCLPFLAHWPHAPLQTDRDIGAALAKRPVTRTAEPLDGPLHDPTLDDYLRALRVVAGQVTLAGDTQPRPIQNVYIEMEIRPPEKRRKALDTTSPESETDSSDPAALREEVEARRNAMWDLPTGEIIQADAIHTVARRVLLWGPAGTGKSTLLRSLACKSVDEARVPVWVPRLVDLTTENFAEALAARALQSVGLPEGHTPARAQLTEAIERGQAILFLDGFDEAPPATRALLPDRIAEMPPDLRVVLASRPLRRIHTGLVEVTLAGLPATGAEAMLKKYFGDDQNWIRPLLDNLGALPDGMAWLTTPVLLGLAASIYQCNRDLPNATLDLYEAVLRQMLERLSDPPRIRQELHQIARRMLVPGQGEPTVTIHEGSLSYKVREDVLATGLFTGDEWLRFTHLTFGEYLAAGAGLDLATEREKERNLAIRKNAEETALEVLPMAHALQGLEALEDVLSDVRERETVSHSMLRLLLRAIGYGGNHVQAFCKKHVQAVLELIAERLQGAAGRFGDLERQLMADAERTAPVLRSLLDADMRADVVRNFQPVLATEGEIGTEAHVLMVNLGLHAPERRVSRWWPTVHRQARALVRTGVSVDELIKLTNGANQFETHLAVEVLGKFEDYRNALRPLIDYPWSPVREKVIGALSMDPTSMSRIRERLEDEEGIVRSAAVDALARHPQHRKQHIDRLIECLGDPDLRVRSTAVSHLLNEEKARPHLRKLIGQHVAAYFDEARDAAILGFADDPDSRSLIQEVLEYRDKWHRVSERVLSELAQRTSWLPFVRQRLSGDDPDSGAIKALGDVKDFGSWPRIRDLLQHHPSEFIRQAAVNALAQDPDSRAQILRRLENKDENEYVRSACVEAIGLDLTYRAKIRELLADPSAEVRCRAIDVLGRDESELELLFALLDDPESNPRHSAIRALAQYPDKSREALWSYFSRTRTIRPNFRISYDGLRGWVVEQLAHDPQSRARIYEALSDDDYEVRKAAIKALQDDPTSHDAIRPLLNDSHFSVLGAAFQALANEPAVRERLKRALKEDLYHVRISGFWWLVRHEAARRQLLDLLQHGRGPVRQSVIGPLACHSDARQSLYEYLDDQDSQVQVTVMQVLRREPEMRRRLRALIQNDQAFTQFQHGDPFNQLLNQVVEVLAEDPEAHPLLLERATKSHGHNEVAVLVDALAYYPKARPFLRGLLRNENHFSNVRASAALALAGDGESKNALLSLLDAKSEHLRAAAIEALSDESDVRPRLHAFLSDRHKKVRKAALDALIPGLASDTDTRAVLRERLPIEPEDKLRLQVLEALDGDTEAIPLLRERLRDPSSAVRKAAAKGLRLHPVPAAHPLDRISALRLALRLAGRDPEPGTPLPSLAPQDRLDAFVKTPRPFHLDRDPAFSEAILGWLLARLAWAGPEGEFRDGRVFGEIERPVNELMSQDAPLVVRVAMDSSNLPLERWLYPNHNLIEAWRVARHLSTDRPITFFLACADVTFEHLTPPALEPGQVYWGPTFFGFRLQRTPPAVESPIALLNSTHALHIWGEASEEERERFHEMLGRLATDPQLDPWAVVPVLSRIGSVLPKSLQEAFLDRLPAQASHAVYLLEEARRGLRSRAALFGSKKKPYEDFSEGWPIIEEAGTLADPRTLLQQALQPVRDALERSTTIEPAIDEFERAVKLMTSSDIGERDRDNAVMLLDGLREKTTSEDLALRILAIASRIEQLPLSREARRRLQELQLSLRILRDRKRYSR